MTHGEWVNLSAVLNVTRIKWKSTADIVCSRPKLQAMFAFDYAEVQKASANLCKNQLVATKNAFDSICNQF